MAAEIHPRKSKGKGKEKDKGSEKASGKTMAWVKAGKATSMNSVTPIADRVGQIHGRLGIQWTRQNKARHNLDQPQKKRVSGFSLKENVYSSLIPNSTTSNPCCEIAASAHSRRS